MSLVWPAAFPSFSFQRTILPAGFFQEYAFSAGKAPSGKYVPAEDVDIGVGGGDDLEERAATV